MLLPDYRQAELEARSTSGSSLRTAAALGWLLAASQLTVSPGQLPEPVIVWPRILPGQTAGTAAEILSLRVVETADPLEITYPLVPRGRATVVAHRGALPPFSWDF